MPYLQSLIQPLLSKPDSLTIEESIDERGKLLAVSVDAIDMGKVIGHKGATINAIRALIHQWGAANQQHISIKVLEPKGRIGRFTNSNSISAYAADN